jgi:hypothetical protein
MGHPREKIYHIEKEGFFHLAQRQNHRNPLIRQQVLTADPARPANLTGRKKSPAFLPGLPEHL